MRETRPFIAACCLAVLAPMLAAPAASSASTSETDPVQWVRDHIGDQRKLSLGTAVWLAGPPGSGQRSAVPATNPSFGSNVDANDPSRDVARGQSETAIAAASGNVMAAWNDISGALYADTTDRHASITGVGFSSDGGRTFTDLIGLPNNNPAQRWNGDPTVGAIDSRHFVVGSLYFPNSRKAYDICQAGGSLGFHIAVSVATVALTGNSVSFTEPIKAAVGGNLCKAFTGAPPPDLALLDKPFLSYDAVSRTLAISYTRFFLVNPHSRFGQIEVVRARVPVDPRSLTRANFSKRIVVWPEESCDFSDLDPCGDFNQGSYPSVAPGGDIYVAWERNWVSNFFNGDPRVYIHAALVRAGASRPSVGGPGDPRIVTRGQANSVQGGVKSMDAMCIAGYSRCIGNDFPRVAVDGALGKVVFVWNDASQHPQGDIWLRALPMDLAIQGGIHRVNDRADYSLHFMPALSVGSNGAVNISWYDRRLGGADSTLTDYYGERRSSPETNGTDFRITTGSTDWKSTSSLISPNFGDYTDNVTDGSTTYYAWSDGRIGVPQPFVDSHG